MTMPAMAPLSSPLDDDDGGAALPLDDDDCGAAFPLDDDDCEAALAVCTEPRISEGSWALTRAVLRD